MNLITLIMREPNVKPRRRFWFLSKVHQPTVATPAFTAYANSSLNKFIKYNCGTVLSIQRACIRSVGSHVNRENNGHVTVVASGKDAMDFMAFTDSSDWPIRP